MSEENKNEWTELDFYVTAYDHIKGEWRDVNVMEMSEEDFRKWVFWVFRLMGVQINIKKRT